MWAMSKEKENGGLMKKYLIAMLMLAAICKGSTSNDVYDLTETAWSPCSGNIFCHGRLQIVTHYTPNRYRLVISLIGMQCTDKDGNRYHTFDRQIAESTEPTFSVSSWVEFGKVISAGAGPNYTVRLTYTFENGFFDNFTIEDSCK